MVLHAAFGLVHAPHLTIPNLEYMIGDSPILEKKIKSNYKLISGSKYRPMQCLDLRCSLQEILEEIFQHSTRPERLFEAGVSFLDKELQTSLFVLGHTTYLVSLRRILQKKRVKVSVRSNSSTQESFDLHNESESVAIVGMSGRFPGSDNVEELWTSIMERKEFHKKVRIHGLDHNFDERLSLRFQDSLQSIRRRQLSRSRGACKKFHYYRIWLFSRPSWPF